ncbi:hypothetical protein, conserved [Eimeria tenella]|uniref:Uncharacterized protein n=1 Tax=Eimeria tenella TaxID=5802 RepID=U6KYA7_EIMTE|nr:hypothetical protein, conserved [Eimeria tenella]CDJ41334.1 hypothetical protein, conserved [Eimeria tenella]|eukprot:XP_013232084.1 hypothetical protein, conserved [Eimeria tenella]
MINPLPILSDHAAWLISDSAKRIRTRRSLCSSSGWINNLRMGDSKSTRLPRKVSNSVRLQGNGVRFIKPRTLGRRQYKCCAYCCSAPQTPTKGAVDLGASGTFKTNSHPVISLPLASKVKGLGNDEVKNKECEKVHTHEGNFTTVENQYYKIRAKTTTLLIDC